MFVLQVSGEKHWVIHAPVHPDPLKDQVWTDHRAAVADAGRGTPVIDRVLRPGDALYLPRGWIHSATALGDTSIHLTVGLSAYTRADVVDTLLSLVGDSAALRASLPLGIDVSDPDQLRPIVEETVADLVAALTADGPGEPDRATPRRPVRPRHPPGTGRPAGHARRDHGADRAHPRPVAQRLRRPHRDGGRPRAADRPGHGAVAARRGGAGPARARAPATRSPSGRSPGSTWPARSSSSAACCARAWW